MPNLYGGPMRRFLLFASLFLMLSMFSFQAFPAIPTYVGVDKCKTCHSGPEQHNIYEKWKKSKHTNAFELLKKKGQDKNPKCIYCHTTGYTEGGYKPGSANAAKFEGVQCESCHGAGSAYMEIDHMDTGNAVENGLIIPMESLCIKCHNKDCPSFKGFNYKASFKKITHTYREQL